MGVAENILSIRRDIPENVTLIAVSKTKSIELIREAVNAGHLHFGENKAQELNEKQVAFGQEIRWHFIGHLQRNKVKIIAPFVSLIHSIDSERLLREVNREAGKINRKINCLLQVHIAKEDTKFGFSDSELLSFLEEGIEKFENIRICGLMGMATFTENQEQVRQEFRSLTTLFSQVKETYFSSDSDFKEISMGMSGDYKLAIEEGSTMVRVGSAIFGERN